MAAYQGNRWDGLGPGQGGRQFDPNGQPIAPGSAGFVSIPNNFVRSGLIDRQVNTIDPSYYDCIYGVANTGQQVIERCYKDIGCCANGCCDNDSWHTKYGWAVALIVIFCALVIIAFVVWLIVWLINRSKDKQLKRQYYATEETYSQMPTPQPTYPPEQYSFEPPHHRDGYRY
ncbi:hypothetical protein WR25_16776 [Diploscapter pachys]|uniref:CX domain-containing protein n=1 Tax=Diploscapter pachys TaxID=2018661 RepID=A0A2A2JJV6_9BILA|nr:hypothetical protein WR25_11508 [Diploscapter pachys]PAV82353.1 hypothetical protein WR25_16776 [Diploscapter pachys]